MASHDPAAPTQARDRAEGHERKAFDKSQDAPAGSIGKVLLVAAALVGAAGGLIYVGRDYVERAMPETAMRRARIEAGAAALMAVPATAF